MIQKLFEIHISTEFTKNGQKNIDIFIKYRKCTWKKGLLAKNLMVIISSISFEGGGGGGMRGLQNCQILIELVCVRYGSSKLRFGK